MENSLREKVIRFCRRLKQEGIPLTQAETLKALEALSLIDLLDRQSFYCTLRTTLIFNEQHYHPFHRVFVGFWQDEAPLAGKENRSDQGAWRDEHAVYQEPDLKEVQHSDSTLSSGGPNHSAERLFDDLNEHELRELDMFGKVGTYSADEQLVLKQFLAYQLLSEHDAERAFAILLKLLRTMLAHDQSTVRHRHIHLQKTIRKNMQYGASELFRLYPRSRGRQRYCSLVTLADISGSMEHYVKLYLPLLHRLHSRVGNSEIFFFQYRHPQRYCLVPPQFRSGMPDPERTDEICFQRHESR